MFDYTRIDLRKSLLKVGINKNDIVFCHSNIGFFGRIKNMKDKYHLCKVFFEEIFKTKMFLFLNTLNKSLLENILSTVVLTQHLNMIKTNEYLKIEFYSQNLTLGNRNIFLIRVRYQLPLPPSRPIKSPHPTLP